MEKGRVLKKLKKVLIAMICTIVVVFSMPIKSKATILEDVVDLLLKIPDGIMYLGNQYLSGRASSETMEKINVEGLVFGGSDEGNLYNFYITPYDMFCNGSIRTERGIKGMYYEYKVLPIFYANFFKDNSQTVINSTNSGEESIDILRPAISNVYKYLRNLAIIVMMLVLMYIGIRIIISSAATEQSKYKQMLIDWVVGLCLLFVMHYIMSFIMNITDIIVDMLVADETQSYYISFDELGTGSGNGEEWFEFCDDRLDDPKKELFIESHLALKQYTGDGGPGSTILTDKSTKFEDWEKTLDSSGGIEFRSASDPSKIATAKDKYIKVGVGEYRKNWGKNGNVTLNAFITTDDPDDIDKEYKHLCIYRGNLLEYIRTISSFGRKYVHVYNDSEAAGYTSRPEWEFSTGNSVLYLALVIETIMFVFIYFKRLLQLSFLTMIAPLVAFMYPLDKVGDGKAQAFNTWFKDYLFTALLQPFHLLLYTVFITAAVDLFNKNIIYALAVYAFMIPAEKYFKKILGFEKSSAASGSGLAGAAGGLLAMRGFDKIAGLGPHGRGKGGDSSGRRKGIRISRRSTSAGAGTAPTSGGDSTIGSNVGRAASRAGATSTGQKDKAGIGNSKNTRTQQNDPNAPNAGAYRRGDAAKRAIKGAVSRALTGGRYNSLKGLSKEAIVKSTVGRIGANVGGAALKVGTGAVTAGVGTALGAIVGGATAIATGDASALFKGMVTGGVAGYNRGSRFGGSVANGIGGIVSDAEALRANQEEEYHDRILADQTMAEFAENGIDLDDKQTEIARAVAPYKDLKGDPDKLAAYERAFEQLGVDVNNEAEVRNAIDEVSEAGSWGDLREDSRKNSFLNREMANCPSDADIEANLKADAIDAEKAKISDDSARARAEEIRNQKIADLERQRAEAKTGAEYMDLMDKITAEKTSALDIDGAKSQMATNNLVKAQRDTYMADAQAKLDRLIRIQAKLK